MATSIVSVLTGIPVRRDIAMTGEITLRGRVLPIGGLKEKLLAALRAGITTVFIPKENEKDLAEIPDNVKKHLKMIPVADVDEVIAQALARRPEPIEWEEPPDRSRWSRSSRSSRPPRCRWRTEAAQFFSPPPLEGGDGGGVPQHGAPVLTPRPFTPDSTAARAR